MATTAIDQTGFSNIASYLCLRLDKSWSKCILLALHYSTNRNIIEAIDQIWINNSITRSALEQNDQTYTSTKKV